MHTIISNNTFKVTICDLKNEDRNMADNIEHQDKGELVANCDQLQNDEVVVTTPVESRIMSIRGKQIMIDRDLVELYGVETRVLNQAVKRNMERFAVNTIVMNKDNEVSSCDVPFSDDLQLFNEDYLKLTTEVVRSCENHDLTESMVIGTSALAQYEIDGAVGMYSGIFNNPFMIWGKYHKGFFRTTLTVSFQFHHTQMDGAHAAKFLDRLQQEINKLLV